MLYEICSIHKVAKMRGELPIWSVWFYSALVRSIEEGNTEVKTKEEACDQCMKVAMEAHRRCFPLHAATPYRPE